MVENVGMEKLTKIEKVGCFENVSFKQFEEDAKKVLYVKTYEPIYKRIQLPKRATIGSAGYDFKAPFDFVLKQGETRTIPTGIRAIINEGWLLAIFPRSSHGFKYRVQLDNTVGIIDSDYKDAANEGHILIKITNDCKQEKTLRVDAGTGFAQGIFLPYGITYDDDVSDKRTGGFGSTDATASVN